jgi:hypothetical protein
MCLDLPLLHPTITLHFSSANISERRYGLSCPGGLAKAQSEPSSISGTMTRSGRIFLSGLHRFVHTWSNGSNTCRGRVKLMTNHNELPSMGCSDDRVRSEDCLQLRNNHEDQDDRNHIQDAEQKRTVAGKLSRYFALYRLRCSALVLPRCNRPVQNVLQSTMPLKAGRPAD